MDYRIHTEADLDAALASLLKIDARFEDALAVGGRPPLRRRTAGFAGLASIVVSQQVSTASARAIWARLSSAFDPFETAAISRARTQKLARTGLSTPKIRTLKAVARAITREEIDLASLAHRPADDAHRMLTAIHGIGPWTADIYLLFCLGHADAWPAGDLALQEAVRLLLRREARPTAREMGPLAETWRPWRGAAAYVLWAYYGALKRRVTAVDPTSDSREPAEPKKARPMGKRDGR